ATAPLPAQRVDPPTVNVVTVDAQNPTPKAAASARSAAAEPTQRAPRKRDGLERHALANPAPKTETPETAALVRESAKLDPSLPPPQVPVGAAADRYGAHSVSSRGGNPVAAAMTDQLVRQSSSFTPPAQTTGASATAR
ncbi:TPA: extensin, partial [Burkholderia dolosa]